MPTFQGGDMNEFSRWLNKRISVPEGCNHAGKMKVGFVVDENGEVKDVKILESVCPELDASMLFLVSLSPKWEPATASGHAVAQFLTIPIEFQLR
jgi:protein TonB